MLPNKILFRWFVVIAVISLAVSTAALVVTAKLYSDVLLPLPSPVTAERTETTDGNASQPADSGSVQSPVITSGEETTVSPDTVANDIQAGADTQKVLYYICYSDGELFVKDSAGSIITRKVFDIGKLPVTDSEKLTAGIGFSDYDTLRSALNDILS